MIISLIDFYNIKKLDYIVLIALKTMDWTDYLFIRI